MLRPVIRTGSRSVSRAGVRIARASARRSTSGCRMAATSTIRPPRRSGMHRRAKPLVRFGLGSNRRAEKIEVRWPGGELDRKRRGGPHRRCCSGGQAVTTGKAAIAILALALTMSGASRSYADYEKANALFIEKKLPEALAAIRRGRSTRSATGAGPDVESQTGTGGLPARHRPGMFRTDARD
jgi:hypothetical protein